MGSEVRKEDIEEIIISIGNKKDDLRIKGMENIHPMYEALVALMKRQLKDEEIASMIYDEESLRLTLAADVFLERVSSDKKEMIRDKIRRRKPIEEVIENAALCLSENKRIKDGELLYHLDLRDKDRYFKKALISEKPQSLYLSPDELNAIKKKKEKIKRNSLIIKVAGSLAAAGLLYLSFLGGVKYSEIRESKRNLNSLMNKEVTSYSEKSQKIKYILYSAYINQ